MLLRHVNDSVDALKSLCLALVNIGVIPYYLHQLDRVEGAVEFDVDTKRGTALMHRLREQLPGYAVPRYVSETPGEQSKKPIT